MATDYLRLAPSVEKEWVEQFVLEQRLLGVSGKHIGDSLAVVQSHVAESGESARDAFGDAQAYAVADAPEQKIGHIDSGWVLGIALGLAGMLLSNVGALAAFSGEGSLTVTVGMLVVGAVIAGVLALVIRAPRSALRTLAAHPARSWTGWMLFLATTVVALLVLQHPIAEIGAVATLIVGAALIAAGVAVQLRAYLGGRVDDDSIIGPGERPAKSRAALVAVFIFPVATAIMVGVSWLLQQIPELV